VALSPDDSENDFQLMIALSVDWRITVFCAVPPIVAWPAVTEPPAGPAQASDQSAAGTDTRQLLASRI
jgi:hypothetical protein